MMFATMADIFVDGEPQVQFTRVWKYAPVRSLRAANGALCLFLFSLIESSSDRSCGTRAVVFSPEGA